MSDKSIQTAGLALTGIGAAGCAVIQGYIAGTLSGQPGQLVFIISTAASVLVAVVASAAALTRATLMRRARRGRP